MEVLRNEKMKTRKNRKSRRSQNVRAQDNLMGDDARESTPAEPEEPNVPEEWVAIAAYYIWKSEGEPQGREADHWGRAKADIRQLQQEGILPVANEKQ
jgi:hypothetical protein